MVGDTGACHTEEVDGGQRPLLRSVHTFPQSFLIYLKTQLNPSPLEVSMGGAGSRL